MGMSNFPITKGTTLADLVCDIRSKVRHPDPLSGEPLDRIMELPVLGET